MGIKFSNNAEGTLAGGINATVTTLDLNSGLGAAFPVVAGGTDDFFFATLTNAGGDREIIKVTQHTSGDTFQVFERAADSIAEEAVPTAYTFSTNDTCQLRVNKLALEGFDIGCTDETYQINTEDTGPLLKNSSGDLEIRNAADADYANLHAEGLTLEAALAIGGAITGATTINASGAATVASLVLSGTITGATTINASGAITGVSLALGGAITGATNITASGTITAEQITSTDDITAAGDISGAQLIAGAAGYIGAGLTVIGSQTIGDALTVTGQAIVGDHEATGVLDQVVNVSYGTGSPPTVTNTTIGSLFIKYVA